MPRSTVSARKVDRLSLRIRDLYQERAAAIIARSEGVNAGELLQGMRRSAGLQWMRAIFGDGSPYVRYLAGRLDIDLATYDREVAEAGAQRVEKPRSAPVGERLTAEPSAHERGIVP